jgi:hypothetical protein
LRRAAAAEMSTSPRNAFHFLPHLEHGGMASGRHCRRGRRRRPIAAEPSIAQLRPNSCCPATPGVVARRRAQSAHSWQRWAPRERRRLAAWEPARVLKPSRWEMCRRLELVGNAQSHRGATATSCEVVHISLRCRAFPKAAHAHAPSAPELAPTTSLGGARTHRSASVQADAANRKDVVPSGHRSCRVRTDVCCQAPVPSTRRAVRPGLEGPSRPLVVRARLERRSGQPSPTHPSPRALSVLPTSPRSSDVLTNKTELEKKLDEALSKANWGASTTLLREIAQATYDP